MENLAALERPLQPSDDWSTHHLRSLEKQLSSASSTSTNSSNSSSGGSSLPSPPVSPAWQQRSPRLAYSSSFKKPEVPTVFQMPLHYPRYSQSDYDAMPEWKLDRLLEEYGLPIMGSLHEKKQYAMGIFLWK